MTVRLRTILEEVKLEHLLSVFADQGIKDDIILHLTDSDLKELGISKMGDRKRLLLAFSAPSEFPLTGTVMLEVKGGALPEGSAYKGLEVPHYEIGKYPVMREEWDWVRVWGLAHGYEIEPCATNGSKPVTAHVAWCDAIKWCNAKSEHEGFRPFYNLKGQTYRHGQHGVQEPDTVSSNFQANGYRLPTAPEWEWAARGGPLSEGYKYAPLTASGEESGPPSVAQIVGNKVALELGVYLMSDSVWEWCWDREESGVPLRIRGACWSQMEGARILTCRFTTSPESRHGHIGFRLARTG
jgi:formylglycine-generating enzyme required for sulfatase activity